MKGNTEATWFINLNCTCPNCKEYIDLLEHPDFWDGRVFGVGENYTDNSKDVDVNCPECDHEFKVDCVY